MGMKYVKSEILLLEGVPRVAEIRVVSILTEVVHLG